MFYRRTIEPAKKLHMKVNDNIYKVKCFQNVMKSVEKVSIEIYCKWLIPLRMNEFFLLSSIFEWFFLSSCSVCDICLLIWEAHWGTFVDMQHLSSSLLSIMYLEVQKTSSNTKTHLENLTIQEITYIHIFFMGMHWHNAHFLSDSL